MRVLVIDDDDVVREQISLALRGAGHAVHELPSAIGATRAIFRHDIEVVVVDVVLPDISGDKLARVLRQNRRGDDLWIVLISGRAPEELAKLGTESSVDAIVSKRNLPSDLLAAFPAPAPGPAPLH